MWHSATEQRLIHLYAEGWKSSSLLEVIDVGYKRKKKNPRVATHTKVHEAKLTLWHRGDKATPRPTTR